MKKRLLSLLLLIVPLIAFAQDKGLDERINDWFMPIASGWEEFVLYPISIANNDVPIVVILLVLGATFFTFYFKFPSITKFPLAINTVRGKKYDDIEEHSISEEAAVNIVDGDVVDTIRDENEEGEVSHFRGLGNLPSSGTVGLGNISGVAVAIALGGQEQHFG